MNVPSRERLQTVANVTPLRPTGQLVDQFEFEVYVRALMSHVTLMLGLGDDHFGLCAHDESGTL
jgi:hypothetical protein